jgi:hypothetical protein
MTPSTIAMHVFRTRDGQWRASALVEARSIITGPYTTAGEAALAALDRIGEACAGVPDVGPRPRETAT